MHIAAWTLLFSLPALLRPSYTPDQPPKVEPTDPTTQFIIYRINDLTLIGFFYFNALVLMPRLMYPKKYAFYILSVLLSFGWIVCQGWLLTISFTHPDAHYTFRKHLFFSTFIVMFILACSIAYRTIRDKVIADNLAKEKENENLKTELSLLRSQVSPHFMFNILNNMVSLARKKSDELEPSLMKLSSLMRYMLYETDEEKVTLDKETDYLQSFIDLQKQRFGKKVQINTNMPAGDKTYFIEPMLLIPFVENAFKHGTGMISDAQINIDMMAINNQLTFIVKNRFEANSIEIKDKSSGIGLANVRRRLDLLYHDKHNLLIDKNNGYFTVTLQIQLT